MATVIIKRHWARLRELGCIVTGFSCDVTIHHCHSGSMVYVGVNRGGGEKVSDWLTIPLNLYLHSMGPEAIDGAKGVLTWEQAYGTQVSLLDKVCQRLEMNVWERAGVAREVEIA